MTMDLFTQLEALNQHTPLAEILRPKTLDEFLGQSNVVAPNSPLLNLLKTQRLFSLILWGTPGCGKTTLARLIATKVNAQFIELSAVTSGIKEIKETVEQARQALRAGQKTILFIDEIHRYSKTQQDALLPHVENGTIFLIGSTTENPSFQVVPALLSRVQVIRLNPINDVSMAKIVNRGFEYLEKHYQPIQFDEEVTKFIVNNARGDARCALNLVENSYFASNFSNDTRLLSVDILESITQKRNTRYSTQEHYDCASAFQKSLRGSDPNAAIYYLAKMIEAGEDPRFIARRLIVCAAEDVGLADPQALVLATSAMQAVHMVGMPEARIILAEAAVYVANCKKSNATYLGINRALEDVANQDTGEIPMHIRNAPVEKMRELGYNEGYLYPHDFPGHWVDQQYLPDKMLGTKYYIKDENIKGG